MYDYADLIPNAVQPGIEEDVFFKPYDELVQHFTEDTKVYSGSQITREIRTSVSSNARNYDKSDVDPVAGTFETATAYWAKIYQDTAAEVHNIDISEAAGIGGTRAVINLFQDAIKMETESLWALIFDDVYAQIKLDLLASGTYSDAALSRTTYPVLLPYNEITDTGLTPALLRTCMQQTRLNKKTSPIQGYKFLVEPAAYFTVAPQIQLLHTWNVNGVAGQPIAGGWQPIGNFEGSDLAQVTGATTGDVFYIRPQDVRIHMHRAVSMTPVPSGRDSVKVIIRTGINAYVMNVGLQGMMINKD